MRVATSVACTSAGLGTNAWCDTVSEIPTPVVLDNLPMPRESVPLEAIFEFRQGDRPSRPIVMAAEVGLNARAVH